MNNDPMERIFDAAFEASANQPQDDSIDPHPSWLKVQRKLAARRTRKNFRSRLSKLSLVAASILIGATLFGDNEAARAIDPVYAKLKQYPSGMLSFFFGRSDDTAATKAKTPPPPEALEGLSVERVSDTTVMVKVYSRDHASKLVSFRAPSFPYIPTGYSFDTAQLYLSEGSEKADHAVYMFHTKEEKLMFVSLQKIEPNTGFGTNVPREGVTVKPIQLSSGPAILSTTTNGSSAIEAIVGGIYINMSGIVASDELIRMAEEMFDS
ncbi:DUF4367 domain-containing protein [Cohnella mopanensis]|uniref:DUF4367 domain-containing protein n=1 Tax=Cohnella mopanensis TaxID=2911966 RepID=UPI001EF83178|nr:DUF4367 domain-containing protein [Cohnella mopanensis]